MSNVISKKILLSLLVVIFGLGISYANPTDSIRIDLGPIRTEGPNKPQAPSFIKLSAYAINGGVVVMSNVDLMAEVKIFDAACSQTYYNSIVALAPDCRCPLPPVDAELTLQVIIDDKIYQGIFSRK